MLLTTTGKYVVGIVFAFWAGLSQTTTPTPVPCEQPVVLEVREPQTTAKVPMRINNLNCDAAGILRELSREIEKCGRGRAASVLVSDKQPLAVLSSVRGLVSKAGIVRVRYFAFNSDTGKMGEIFFGEVVPYPNN